MLHNGKWLRTQYLEEKGKIWQRLDFFVVLVKIALSGWWIVDQMVRNGGSSMLSWTEFGAELDDIDIALPTWSVSSKNSV